MLCKDSFVVAADTFALIQKIQAITETEGFYLAGGTALALQYGHRNSIDIDLFTVNEFEPDLLVDILQKHFKVEVAFQRGTGTLLTFINNIKTDFILHDYPLIRTPQNEDSITFLAPEDIAAMKVNAIVNSGKRLKDFVDIYYLLEHFSLKEIVSFFEHKYPQKNALIALKSLSYFDDIDLQIDPPKTKTEITLPEIMNRINRALIERERIFQAE